MRLFYTDHFELPLPQGHRFPMEKYRLLRQRVVVSDAHRRDLLLVPEAATKEQLGQAHTLDYVDRVFAGKLSAAEIRRIGFPWSEKMAERSRRSTGATLAAARAALTDGVSANLAGGTHHAGPDWGEGYCVFNDAAVTLRVLRNEGAIQRAVVIDCDVHQGNGTAAILAGDHQLLTYSIHGDKNFPLRKFPSDWDIPVDDGANDEVYLAILEDSLNKVFDSGHFDLAIYLAGADPFEGDRLGRLKVTKSGLMARDRIVMRNCLERSIPVAVAMAGGYARSVHDIVDIHAATLAIASEFQSSMR